MRTEGRTRGARQAGPTQRTFSRNAVSLAFGSPSRAFLVRVSVGEGKALDQMDLGSIQPQLCHLQVL